jgi:hypothetical protein
VPGREKFSEIEAVSLETSQADMEKIKKHNFEKM